MEFDILRKVLIKSDELDSDPSYGCDPDKRGIENYIRLGIVNLDKPSGPTSHQVTSWVKDILHVEKAGHSGTLDPKVTGVLPIAVEDSTKIVQTLLTSGKEYVTVMKLHGDVKDKDLVKTLKYFTGKIIQRPPVKSAVKRELRERTVYYITLLEHDGRDVLFQVGCEAGTYIRKLCHDIGLLLGCGAHMDDLRRTRAGPFDESSIVSLYDLKDAYQFYIEDGEEEYLRQAVTPVEKAVENLGKIWINDSAVDSLCHGASLKIPGIIKLEDTVKRDDLVAVYTLKNELVCIGTALRNNKDLLEKRRGEAVKLERVVMKPGTYPRMWGGHQAD